LKLLYKFFFAFFITNLTLVGLLLVLIAVNLSTGFNDFVTAVENKHLTDTKQQLISIYQQQNSWRPIVNNVQIWRDIVDPQAKRPPPPPKPRSNSRYNQAPSPRGERARPFQAENSQAKGARPRENQPAKHSPKKVSSSDFLQTGKRLSLYDHNKNVIVGKRYLNDNQVTQSIEFDGQIIGWLGLKPSQLAENSPASEFLTQQYKSYYLMAAATVLLAFVTAFIFSKHLMAPIKQLISGTNKLIQGNYQSRIKNTTRDELATLSDHVNVLANTLEKNQKNRFQWMSDTSHELRTPLTVLRAQLIAIQDGIFVADEKRVQLFIDEIDNLSHIVDDLYQLSSSDAGGLTYQKIELNPIELLMQVSESFAVKFEQQSFVVDVSSLEGLLADNDCQLLADKDRLRQLFANLLENSCRYTQTPGKINISASHDKHFITIMIQDSAPGVVRAAQEKLFDRFYRVEQSRNRNHGGSGLGLALCKQIVEAHQGTITALDSHLGGLSIKMTFPLLKKLS
jgi:two-component system sensor histidine kinase BaeS